MLHARCTSLLAAVLFLGCGPAAVTATPRYPSAPHIGDSGGIGFTPASGITRLEIPCAEVERPIDNGLDDDCDGRVDRQAEASNASLFISLVHNTQVDLELALTAAEPSGQDSLAKSVVSRVQVCQSAAPFAIQQAAFAQLAKGRYELAVAHGKTCGADLPATVNASLWLQGQAQGVYAVNVAPGGRAVLGTIEVR